MHSSEFDDDDAAAFAGGGFMPSQATQGPDSSFYSSKNRDAQVLLPLTIKQISDAFQSSDDKSNMIIDGVDVTNVTLVGRVCNKAGRITDVAFVLDDGTGRIECNKWLQEAVDSIEMEGISDGMYVRLHGHLKGFQGKMTVNVFSLRTRDEGVPRELIARQLGIPLDKLMLAIKNLIEEGAIYEAIGLGNSYRLGWVHVRVFYSVSQWEARPKIGVRPSYSD
ncbi:replication protein A 32 kDa subunit B-like [Senna tora]|uniref:Replication protein A 32 kDa subunit B-like n=1 Tax=Senna tora TaxID=362788 RepID=A0A834T3T8_9FABA|nr:replication protein A 32 kDa subunit B-like [Senna tora]